MTKINIVSVEGIEYPVEDADATANKLDTFQGTANVGKAMVVQANGKLAPQTISPGGNPSFADITGQPTDNTNLATALNGKVDKVSGKGLSTNDYTNADKTAVNSIDTKVNAEAVLRQTKDNDLQAQIDAIEAKSLVKDIVGTHANLLTYDVSKLVVDDRIEVLQDETHSNAVSFYRYTGGAQPSCWEFIGSTAETYTKTESDSRFVPQTRKINTKPLSSDITLSASDVNALPTTTTLADLSGDSTHRTVTDAEKTSWNNKVDSVAGKGLSSNDYTTAEKTKLNGIADNAQVNVIESVKVNGISQMITSKAVDITVPTALSSLTEDATHRTVTDTEKTTWNNKQDALTIDTELKTDSDNPVTNKAITEEVNKKLGKQYTSAEDGYIAKVDSADHVLKVMPGGTSSVSFADLTGQPTDNTNLATALNGKVDKVSGKGLSTNDYDNTAKGIVDGVTSALSSKVDKVTGKSLIEDTEITRLAGIESGAQVNKIETIKVNGTAQTITSKSIDITVNKSVVGLGNVDNTSDLSKPVSTATQTALNGKEDSIGTKGTAFNKSFGTTAGTVCEGNDSRLTDTRTPKAHKDSHKKGGTDEVVLDATQITTGVFDADRIPRAAFQKMVSVADTIARLALTTAQVTTGDTVHQLDTSTMYFVKDDTKLGTENAFQVYLATVDWVAITSKPLEFNPTNHASNHATGSSDPLSPADIGAASASAVSTLTTNFNSHISASNPHGITKSTIGLGNVNNTSDLDKPVSTATQTALDGKEPKIATKGTAFNKDFGTTSGTVCEGNDSRLSNARTPTAHKDSHKTGGTDEITPSDIGAASTSALSSHTGNTSNPHNVTKAQIGLGSVVDGAQVNVIETVKVNGTALTPTSKAVNITVPTKVSDLSNDSGYQTASNVDTMIGTHNSSTSAHSDIRTAISGKEDSFAKNTAFNKNFEATATNIKMNGTQSAGSLSTVARADHVHPVDTSRASAGDLTSHTSNTSNPHSVTKAQIGLGNCDNTSDANKPISSATQTALNAKQAQHIDATATLTVAGWSSSTQTVSVSGVTAGNTVILSPSGSSYIHYCEKGVRCTAQGSGTLTFTCKEVPTSDLTVNIVIFN